MILTQSTKLSGSSFRLPLFCGI